MTPVQCECGKKMRAATDQDLAPELVAHLDKVRQILPTSNVGAQICPACKRVHVNVKV